jgi:cell division inhibitor SulA
LDLLEPRPEGAMTEEYAKTTVLLTLRSIARAVEPAVLAVRTGLASETVVWVLDRLREEEKVKCRVGSGREWWEAL